MDQIQQLIELLKQTPELALYGLGMFLGWKLLTMGSWVSALVIVSKLFINRYFENKKENLEIEKIREQNRIAICNIESNDIKFKNLNKYVEASTISGVEPLLTTLIEELKSTDYIHSSDIREAIRVIRAHKKEKK